MIRISDYYTISHEKCIILSNINMHFTGLEAKGPFWRLGLKVSYYLNIILKFSLFSLQNFHPKCFKIDLKLKDPFEISLGQTAKKALSLLTPLYFRLVTQMHDCINLTIYNYYV